MPAFTRYYDPQASTMRSLCWYSATIFELVIFRGEFWAYIIWNLVATAACIHFVTDEMVEDFQWEAATVMQYVMTFFVTFYNDRCYERYRRLYTGSQDFLDSIVYFVQEMNASMHQEQLRFHRIACSKYLLAVAYEYLTIVCAGKLSRKSWEEFVSRGLLTNEEAQMLEAYPGGQATFVLASWVLFIVRDGLLKECMWGDRAQHTVHIYNRLLQHVVGMVRASHMIGYTQAMPIPFPYYHLMNVILVFNIVLLATFPALFRSYATTLAFAVALLVYMGLRMISTGISDPFGQDPVDFPVPAFISQTFDRTVSLLIAFSRPDVRTRVLKQVEAVQDFTEEQLTRSCPAEVFHNKKRSAKMGSAVEFRWTGESIFPQTDDSIKGRLEHALCEDPEESDEELEHDMDEEMLQEERRLEAKELGLLDEETKKYEVLDHKKAMLEQYLEKLRKLAEDCQHRALGIDPDHVEALPRKGMVVQEHELADFIEDD